MHKENNRIGFETNLPYFSEPNFAARANFLYAANHSNRMGRPIFELFNTVSIFFSALRCNLLVLDSTPRSSLAACLLLAPIPRRLRGKIIMHGEMWAPDGGFLGWLQGLAVRFSDKCVDRYIVWSSEELTEFPKLWGVSIKKTRLVPFFWTLRSNELEPQSEAGDYVFSGGNSHRDYEPLIEAARELPHVRFIIATQRLSNRTDLPPNLIAKAVSHSQFIALLKGARVVVVPLKANLGRSVGQQTYLNSMLLGKPTIVSKAYGVRDHVRDDEDGWIVDGSRHEYLRALKYVLSSSNEKSVARICQNARARASTFTFDRHAVEILAVVDELAEIECAV